MAGFIASARAVLVFRDLLPFYRLCVFYQVGFFLSFTRYLYPADSLLEYYHTFQSMKIRLVESYQSTIRYHTFESMIICAAASGISPCLNQ